MLSDSNNNHVISWVFIEINDSMYSPLINWKVNSIEFCNRHRLCV